MSEIKSAVYVLLADGFESIEALTPVDVLRRAQYPVYTVSTQEDQLVISAQKIPVQADLSFSELPEASEIAAVFIPGGYGGAVSLTNNDEVIELLQLVYASGGLVTSICAGPMALDRAGLTQNHKGTHFPGMADKIHFLEYVEALTVKDGSLLTSRGPATAIYFALHLLGELMGTDVAERIKEDMQLNYVEAVIRGAH